MPALLNVVLTGVHLLCLLLLLLVVAALLWLLLASVIVVKSERGLSVLPFSQDNKRIRIASGKNSLFVVRR